jgi:hypothetical protein
MRVLRELLEMAGEEDIPIIYDIIKAKLAAKVPVYLTDRAWSGSRAVLGHMLLNPQRVTEIALAKHKVDGVLTDYIQLWWVPEINGELNMKADSYRNFDMPEIADWKLTKSARGLELTV